MPEQRNSYSKICLLIFSILITSCSDPEVDKEPELEDPLFEDPLKDIPDKGTINFESPQIGQRNQYVFFEATYSYSSGEVDFTYDTDTLMIAITAKNSEEWIVSQFLSRGSNSRLHPENSYWGNMGDSVFATKLVIADDSIHFFYSANQMFASFTFNKPEKFPLQLVSDDFPENMDGLPRFTGFPSTRWIEFVQNYERLGKTFDRLNIYFDYSDMQTDGYGFTYLYGPTDGLVRIAYINAWSMDTANGWDLISQ